jgi:hypothetical protein
LSFDFDSVLVAPFDLEVVGERLTVVVVGRVGGLLS